MKTWLTCVFALLFVSAAWSQEPAEKPAAPDRAALEKDFSEKLTGATLVGTFSVVGRENHKPERYEIASAKGAAAVLLIRFWALEAHPLPGSVALAAAATTIIVLIEYLNSPRR